MNTPRTDQVVWYDSEAECDVVSADFARELERDLKAALMMRSIYLARIAGLTDTVRTMRDQLQLLFPEGDAN